jgi:hypothetical protein
MKTTTRKLKRPRGALLRRIVAGLVKPPAGYMSAAQLRRQIDAQLRTRATSKIGGVS